MRKNVVNNVIKQVQLMDIYCCRFYGLIFAGDHVRVEVNSNTISIKLKIAHVTSVV